MAANLCLGARGVPLVEVYQYGQDGCWLVAFLHCTQDCLFSLCVWMCVVKMWLKQTLKQTLKLTIVDSGRLIRLLSRFCSGCVL